MVVCPRAARCAARAWWCGELVAREVCASASWVAQCGGIGPPFESGSGDPTELDELLLLLPPPP